MSTQGLSISKVLQFCGRLWLLWFKAALCMSLLSIMASVVQVAVSQDLMEVGEDYGSGGFLEVNATCNLNDINNTNCTDMPADGLCLNCTFSSDCMYGSNTTVECTVPDDVQCVVSLDQW